MQNDFFGDRADRRRFLVFFQKLFFGKSEMLFFLLIGAHRRPFLVFFRKLFFGKSEMLFFV